MAVSYNKLWKMLIDKGMSRTQMRLKAGISTKALAKLGKNESVMCYYNGKFQIYDRYLRPRGGRSEKDSRGA